MTTHVVDFDADATARATWFDKLRTLLAARDVYPTRERSVVDRFGAWTQIV